jgi:hypothetical protein
MTFFLGFASMNTTLGSIGYVFWILAGTTILMLDQGRNTEPASLSDAKAGTSVSRPSNILRKRTPGDIRRGRTQQ